MLVISRKPDEAVMIGDGIEVRVLRVGRGNVRLGIVAAPGVPVHRREVYEQVSAGNRTAVTDPAAARQLLAGVGPDGPASHD